MWYENFEWVIITSTNGGKSDILIDWEGTVIVHGIVCHAQFKLGTMGLQRFPPKVSYHVGDTAAVHKAISHVSGTSLWSLSRQLMSFLRCGSQTVHAYSTWGLTREKYALSFTDLSCILRFLLRTPRVLLALFAML